MISKEQKKLSDTPRLRFGLIQTPSLTTSECDSGYVWTNLDDETGDIIRKRLEQLWFSSRRLFSVVFASSSRWMLISLGIHRFAPWDDLSMRTQRSGKFYKTMKKVPWDFCRLSLFLLAVSTRNPRNVVLTKSLKQFTRRRQFLDYLSIIPVVGSCHWYFVLRVVALELG